MMKSPNYPRSRSLTYTLKFPGIYFSFYKWLVPLLLLVVAAGCKKVMEEPGIKGICPEVIATDPSRGAVNVATVKKISATFNEGMDPASLNAGSFYLKQGSNLIPGTISYTGNTVTFSPSNPLAANTVYTGTITTGAKDPSGNAMVADYVWNFNTGSIPMVVSTDPLNGAVNIALNKVISATFSTVMDAASLNATTFQVKNGNTVIPGTINYSGFTASFTPSLPLSPNTVYSATVTTGAKDTAGAPSPTICQDKTSATTWPTTIRRARAGARRRRSARTWPSNSTTCRANSSCYGTSTRNTPALAARMA